MYLKKFLGTIHSATQFICKSRKFPILLKRTLCLQQRIPLTSMASSTLPLPIYFAIAFLWQNKNNNPNPDKNLQENPPLIKEADILFENGYYEQCYNLLKTCQENGNVEVNWRICRALYNMSKETNNKQYKKDLINDAFNIANKLVEDNYNHFAVQKWYALLLDAKSSYEGIKERIIKLEEVKKHMDLAVTLNPNDATTLHMLGEWCFQITELPWHQRKIAETFFASPPQSTYEDALEYFLKAESVEPRFYSINLLRLGTCYQKLKKDDQAKYYLKLAASYPAKSNDDHQANKEAAELLKKFGK